MYKNIESKAKRDFATQITWLIISVIVASAFLYVADWLFPQSHESSADKSEIQAGVEDTFSRPLVPDASGCEIRSPNGELINKRFDDVDSYQDSKILIEAGTTVNGDCFPDANTTKS